LPWMRKACERAQVMQLQGTVQRIRFTNQESFFTVASLGVEAETDSVTIVGVLPGLAQGMRIRVDGEWQEDRRFGRQFRAMKYVEVVPATCEGVVAYLSSGFIPGIGPKLALRIVDVFGAQTLDIVLSSTRSLRDRSQAGG
jgi:exodeoxyribonuclease V alpha subunit